MKKQKMQYFKLEERVLFEAGAVIQAAEAAAADQAAAEHSNDGEAAAADDAADQTNDAELAEINTEPGADAVAFAAADTEGKTLIVINSSVKDAEQIYNDMGKTARSFCWKPEQMHWIPSTRISMRTTTIFILPSTSFPTAMKDS